ncbi:MAG: hypothetical protein JSS66_11305 [Armatimonadetes bacterium]|nr:hypothetical protein [Armatimonadota bacterium]
MSKRSGTTLIEVLVVIVVFLVGILAIVQVFPPGLTILRRTRDVTRASQLGTSEMSRIRGQASDLPEMIVPVTYTNTGTGLRVTIDTNRKRNDLMPAIDPGLGKGQINEKGQVMIGGNPTSNWQLVSGANLFNRVIGESTPVPAPRRVPGLPPGQNFGSVLQLIFGPAYYYSQPNGIGEPDVVQVYGNDYQRRYGNRDFNQPNPFGRVREGEFYYVAADDTDDTYFPNEDQIWVGPSLARNLRVAFSFAYSVNGQPAQFDVIVKAVLDPNNIPPYALRVGNYWVVSLPELVAVPDIYGDQNFVKANYLYAEGESVRVQRIYDEIPLAQTFDPNDPYQYKVIGSGTVGTGPDTRGYALGTLLCNPVGFGTRVRSQAGVSEALEAKVDYSVFDWRILKDEFRVPVPETVGGALLPKQVKLTAGSIKPRGTEEPDQLAYHGMGLSTPTLVALPSTDTDDIIVEDTDTGAIILGNIEKNPDSAWTVDRSIGQIVFRDVDGNAANGLSAWFQYPTGDPNNPWAPRVLVPDISARNIKVMYMARGEWSVQPFKAARQYRVSRYIGANGLGPGECFIGGSPDSGGNPVGQPFRLYFSPYDLGQKVNAGEVWLTTGAGPFALYDQEFQISGIENIAGRDLAFADIRDKAPAGSIFDGSQGYVARRVRGASLKVRVMWNPTNFRLEGSSVANYLDTNYNNLEFWMRSWGRVETEGLQIGGKN